MITSSYGLTDTDPRYNPLADIDCNGHINQVDLDYIRNEFGKQFPPVTHGKFTVQFRWEKNQAVLSTAKLKLGQSRVIETNVVIHASNRKPFTLRIEQQVEPRRGLNLTGDKIDDRYIADSSENNWFIPVSKKRGSRLRKHNRQARLIASFSDASSSVTIHYVHCNRKIYAGDIIKHRKIQYARNGKYPKMLYEC